MELRSIRDISKELGTDKNVVYRIIKKLGIRPSTPEHSTSATASTKANSTKYYCADDVSKIIEEFHRTHPEHSENARECTENARERSEDTDIIRVLESQIDLLQSQIKALQETNTKQAETISDLTELLHREQELRASRLVIESNTKKGFFARLLSRNKTEPTE